MPRRNPTPTLLNPALAAALRGGALAGHGNTGHLGPVSHTPAVYGPNSPAVRNGANTPAQVATANANNPTSPTGLPIDPVLDATIAGITHARDTTISGLEAQKPQVLANYGYKAAGYDSTGAPTGLTFDTSNPYSRASLLKKNYDQQARGTGNQMAAAGQLYAGAYGNAQNTIQSNRQTANDALTKALVAALVGIAGREQTARNTAETNIGLARSQRMPTT